MDPDEPDYGDSYGEYSRHGIDLLATQDATSMASTLVHECLHAMWDVYGLPESVNEEELCLKLEAPVLAFLVDNVGVVQALRKAVLRGEPLPITKTAGE